MKEVLGQIASVGVLCYAAGKVVNGRLGDFLGAKRFLCWGWWARWPPRWSLGWGSPAGVGLPAPAASLVSLFAGPNAAADQPASLGTLLRPYFRSPAFLLMLVLSFGLTALREAFSFWVPTYLVEAAHLSERAASRYRALYSVFGMVSILGAGHLCDAWPVEKIGCPTELAAASLPRK